MEAVSSDETSSHFLRSGEHTSLSDWFFVHRARLNVLPLLSSMHSRAWREDISCRKCGGPVETLVHVLNQCPAHMQGRIRRHNAVQSILLEALPRRLEVTVDRKVADDETQLRPDIVVRDKEKGTVHIIDVTVPFENRLIALRASRLTKMEKYAELAERTRERKGQNAEVRLGAIIVGSPGTWDRKNDGILRRIGIPHNRMKALKKKIVSAAISGSRTIYNDHVKYNL
ncbi:hypothetical protein J437_LFUL001523 [Ladona fulva]|uniref:Reverse transcriptase n=1 Tax=Ladona fulva TaxID=123851 RepID=A0A8K0JV59_LADFU|nr:hypothetical protein J437_LFUL001523 [Ladona fulva]